MAPQAQINKNKKVAGAERGWGPSHRFSLLSSALIVLYLAAGANGGVYWPKSERVAPNTGQYTSLKLDAAGNPHVAFHDQVNRDLCYAYRNSSGIWFIEVVDSAADVGRFASLDLSSDGLPRVAYLDFTNGLLKYAQKEAGGWSIESLGPFPCSGWYSSLDLDTDGRPHIAFTSCASFDLYYCFRDSSGQWTFETVDDSGEVGLYCCLQLFDGLPRISYYDKTNGHLKYAQKSESGAWLISLVDASPRCGIDTWLAVDPAGVPYISYWDQQNGDLKFAVRQGENWLVETVDSEGSAGYYSSIAVRGWPRISYQGAKGLRYAERINDCWRIYEIEEEGSAAAFTSLAVDSLGNSRISYWRPLSNTLEYIEGVESGTIGGPLRTIAASVGVARLKPSGTWVEVTGAIIVSAGPPAGWHVEESDRSAGIQLKMPHFCWMPSEGDKVRLLGVVETSPLGEIRIQVCDWEVIQPSDVPKAVFVSDAHPLAAGLLVKMAGIVHIADGGIYLGTTRITLAAGWPTPAAGQFVAVAGVLGHPYEGYVLTPRRIEEVMVFDF